MQSVAIEPRTWRLVDGTWEPVRNPLVLTRTDFADLQQQTPSAQGAVMSRGGQARISWKRSGGERQADVDTARHAEARQPNDHRA